MMKRQLVSAMLVAWISFSPFAVGRDVFAEHSASAETNTVPGTPTQMEPAQGDNSKFVWRMTISLSMLGVLGLMYMVYVVLGAYFSWETSDEKQLEPTEHDQEDICDYDSRSAASGSHDDDDYRP